MRYTIQLLLLAAAFAVSSDWCNAQPGPLGRNGAEPGVPAQLEKQKQFTERRLQEIQQEHEQHMAEWDRHFQERNRPQQKEEAGWWNQEAPWWFPVSLIVVLLSIAYWLSQQERKRREQSRMDAVAAPPGCAAAESDMVHDPSGPVEQLRRDAWTVAAMIAEDANREQIFAKVDRISVKPDQVPEFLMALKLSMMTLPIPWYRPDIPQLVEEVCQRVAGEGSERPCSFESIQVRVDDIDDRVE